jgi:hypothetical protein
LWITAVELHLACTDQSILATMTLLASEHPAHRGGRAMRRGPFLACGGRGDEPSYTSQLSRLARGTKMSEPELYLAMIEDLRVPPQHHQV